MAAPQYYGRFLKKRGKYSLALSYFRLLRRFNPNSVDSKYGEAWLHMQLGEFATAEKMLKQIVLSLHSSFVRYGAWESWGNLLLHQQRYAEAEEVFAGLTEAVPDDLGGYRGLAELYLWQRDDPNKTIEVLEKMFERRISRSPNWVNHGELWALKAWALARNRLYFDADEALQKAFRHGNKGNVPSWTLLNVYAGKTAYLRGEKMQADQFFTEAMNRDKEGIYGRLAQEYLTSMEK